jgi:hypothetical protein
MLSFLMSGQDRGADKDPYGILIATFAGSIQSLKHNEERVPAFRVH